jgi:MFS transporter, putative metabolite:H+ symporter
MEVDMSIPIDDSVRPKEQLSPWSNSQVSRRETRRGTWLAFLAMTFAIYDFILFGTVLPVIQEDFGWSASEATAVNTGISVGGALVMLIFGGMVVDKIGRRKGMMLTVAGTALGSGLTALVPGAGAMVAVRSISGLGLAEQGINAVYLNELYAVTEDEKVKKNRGFTFSLVQSGFPVGAILAAALATVLLPMMDWRWLFLVATFPALLLIFMRRGLKETPQFVVEKEIRRMRRSGDHVGAANLAEKYGIDSNDRGIPLVEIFRGRALRPTIVMSLAWITNQFGILSFSILGTSVLTLGKGLSFDQALLFTVIVNMVGFLGYLVHGWAGDRFGRRNVIGIGWLIAGVVFAIMLLSTTDTVTTLVLYAVGTFFLIGPYSALLFYTGECYETHSRATGVNFLAATCQVGAIIAGSILTTLLANEVDWSRAAFYVGAIGVFVSGIVVFFSRKVPEIAG